MNTIEKALDIAKQAHKGQVDKGGNKYIEHPIFVSNSVESKDEKIVALLHDVVEDTDITFNDLKMQGFSDSVIDALDCITKQKNESYNEYINRVCKNPIAIKVKIADLTHNSDISRISNPTDKDYLRVNKYKETLAYLKTVI